MEMGVKLDQGPGADLSGMLVHTDMAEQQAMHAIPLVGNAMADRAGAQDWGGFGANLTGSAQTPPQTSANRFSDQPSPKLHSFIASLVQG